MSSIKLLYFIQLPPPIHGVSKINHIIYKSDKINKPVTKRLIRINFTKKINLINKLSLSKLLTYVKIFFSLLANILFFRPNFIYYTIPPCGIGFLKDIPFIFLLKLFSVQPIFHLHGKGIKDYIGKSKLKFKIYNWVFSNSNIIHLSKILLEEDIYPLKLKNTNLFVLNNGVKKNIPSDFNKKSKGIKILFIANLSLSKGILFACEIFERISKNYNNVELNVIGDFISPIEEKVVNKFLIDKTFLNINFHGSKFGKNKFELIGSMDMLFYPTFNDAFPLIILESLQFGLPVVASDQGAIPEIINDKIGKVFPTGDKELAFKSCSNIIDNLILDKDFYRKNCIDEFEKKYTLEKFEEKLKNIFKIILKNKI